jgi:hypothetical protein
MFISLISLLNKMKEGLWCHHVCISPPINLQQHNIRYEAWYVCKLHASVAGSRVTAFLATAAPWEPYFTDCSNCVCSARKLSILLSLEGAAFLRESEVYHMYFPTYELSSRPYKTGQRV